MAETKPPAKPPVVPPVATVPAKAQPVAPGSTGVPHTKRLLAALASIDEHSATPTNVRSILSSYYRFCNASGTTEHLPRSLRPHSRNPERAASGTGKWDAFFFYAGNAIKALQTAYAQDKVYGSIPASKTDLKLEALNKLTDLIAILESRTKTIEKLAQAGPADWVLKGTDAEGHYLVTALEHHQMMAKAAEVHAQVAKAQGENLPAFESDDEQKDEE